MHRWFSFGSSTLVVPLLLVVACDAKDADDAADVSGAEPDTGDDPTAADTEVVDTGTEGGNLIPAPDQTACDAPADAAPAGFSLDLGDWVVLSEFGSTAVDGECTVSSITDADDRITTALSCVDGDAGPYEVEIQVASADGTPTWAAGDAVTIAAELSDNDQGGLVEEANGGIGASYVHALVSLRDDEGGLLLVGASTQANEVEAAFAPLEMELLGACDPFAPCAENHADTPLQFALSEPAGAEVTLTGGQHAELALTDGTTLVVDAPRAHQSDDCHFAYEYVLAARRIQP
jgi:hypothetical protein